MVSLPRISSSPFKELARRGALALGLLLTTTLLVYVDRAAYSDTTAGDGISFIDALYYATVTVTTTGYGDITPVATHARLINALLILPAAAGRNLARSAPQHALFSVLISMLSGVLGLVFSYTMGSSVGAAVVLCAAGFYALSLLLRKILHILN